MNYKDLKKWPILNFLEPEFMKKIRMAVVFGHLGNEALIVGENNMIYGIGTNSRGCLGNIESGSTYPVPVTDLCGINIKTIAFGSGPHVLALTVEGKVYCWGNNSYTELGHKLSPYVHSPALGEFELEGKFVIDIACGGHHSLMLTDDEEIHLWGDIVKNDYKMYKNSVLDSSSRSIFNVRKAVSIACGYDFNVVLTSKGEVYTWGVNKVGQLGNSRAASYESNPSKVTDLEDKIIRKVACGFSHVLALSNEGTLYVWGDNGNGELGITGMVNSKIPVKLFVKEMGRVLDVAAHHCNHISAAVGERGKIFMWGFCHGQIVKKPMLTRLDHLHDVFAYFTMPSVTPYPLIINQEDENKQIEQSVKEAFDDIETSDLTIIVQEKCIYVHKTILKLQCRYFRTMFQENWIENNQNTIEHNQFSYDVYKSFLKYLYTGEIDLSPEDLMELFYLADAYNEINLKNICFRKIKETISIQNVAFLYNIAVQNKSQEFEDTCLKFALENMTAMVRTSGFAELNPSIAKDLIIKAAQAGAFIT